MIGQQLDIVHFLRKQVRLDYFIKEMSNRASVKLRRRFVACDKCEVPESESSDSSSSEDSSPPLQRERKAYDKEYEVDKAFYEVCFCPLDRLDNPDNPGNEIH